MSNKSKIYTRGGDRGETELIGGRRVPKYHPRIEACGLVDELTAHTSLLRDQVEDPEIKEELLIIMDIQMAAASLLAQDIEDVPAGNPRIGSDQVTFVEGRIDEMDASLAPLHSFVIPGGHQAVSQAHVARTVCRRAERAIHKLASESGVDDELLKFFNRLSDYFFVLSRKIARLYGVKLRPWKSVL